jgi:hypothetical protein
MIKYTSKERFATLPVRFVKHYLPKRLFKDKYFLDFCEMKISIREATLNLQKPCTPSVLGKTAVNCCV